LPDGMTLLGVILSSNKTHITQVRNCQAHPLLISLANIAADVRSKGSTRSYVLLALLPIPKFIHTNKRLCGVLMMSDPLRNLEYCFTMLIA
ncbi:hypothetical protein BU15DRAFT_48113, partial [Melanogaster broomeanus]